MSERRLTYSIIIPVYNKWALTAACLDALGRSLAHRRGDGEIVVVDDASTDETASALAARSDVDRIVRHDVNTGFQGAACDGAAAARGETIVFLNNDTLVQDGWLDALLDELRDPSVGIAGAMFLFPDGRVQEFGGIVWRDASAYHIGAGLTPGDALFAEPRDVDYVSGAGMALAKSFWNELGGFDPQLAPAYYEDTDLCMKVRAAGKRVVVTPRSRIVHVMGGSKDVDPRKSHDTMMAANREKFRAKWKAVLDREHWPAHRYFLDAASRRTRAALTPPPPLKAGGKRLLFAYAIVPQFDRQSGDRRLYEMMRACRDAGHAVTLLALLPDAAQAAILVQAGIDVWHGDISEMFADGTVSTIERQLSDGAFDLVYFGSPQIARLYLGLVRHVLPRAAIVTDAIDLNFHRVHRERLVRQQAANAVVSLPLDRRWEMETYAASDALTSVSAEEQALLRASGITAPIEVVSNFYHSAIAPPPFAGRFGAVIAANMAHHPNVDALQWFVSEVWPRVLTLKPDMLLTICGNGTDRLNFTAPVRNAVITGYLPSMDPVLAHARVNVAPLRIGAGVKGKVTEAMRNGLPTVTTPIGAEGTGEDGAAALAIETDPQRLAEAIVAVHEDEALWNRLSAAGIAVAEKRFSREANAAALERIVHLQCREAHGDGVPTPQAIAQAFADPSVTVAGFNAGARGPQLAHLLRSEPSFGALVGDRETRASFTVPGEIPALVLTRAAFQWAWMRGPCESVQQLLRRMQEGGMLLGCTPDLPQAVWNDAPQGSLVVDVCVAASAQPQRIAAIVEAVKAAAACRLRIVPAGDISPAMPGEVIASAGIDGAAGVEIYDGPVAVPSLFGLLSPTGARARLALDAGPIESAALTSQVESWAARRSTVVCEMQTHADAALYLGALAKPLEYGPCSPLLLANDARQMQLGWAWGLPATRAFRTLPRKAGGAEFVYAAKPYALTELLADRSSRCFVDEQGAIAAVRCSAHETADVVTREDLIAWASERERGGERTGIYFEEPPPAPQTDVKLLALYLPQFHPTPENDRWWGPGFTEWHNVTRAKPLFDGHDQPHVPGELGFYDLRLAETRAAQARLAQAYGVHGFIYYHYWFNGRRMLHEPLDGVLALGEPKMPFALCWANENWTRSWDGRSGHRLIEQQYSAEDDEAHMRWLCTVFEDERYIRIGGRPLFFVYRANLLPDPAATAERWRACARAQGIGEIYLCRVESFPDERSDPQAIGFDAALEFQPDWLNLGEPARTIAEGGHSVFRYRDVALRQMRKPAAPYRRFPCVSPGWDNSPRRRASAYIFEGSTPETYGEWLAQAIRNARELPDSERFVVVNAWNEWAEGNHLEPDWKSGRAYLETTRRALLDAAPEIAAR